jgi:hypothetical protein
MAIEHLSRGDKTARIFERPTDLKGLKSYLGEHSKAVFEKIRRGENAWREFIGSVHKRIITMISEKSKE